MIIIVLVVAFLVAAFITGNNALKNSNKDEVVQTKSAVEEKELIIDATQFNRINSAKLVDILGEPESIEDYPWSVPSTGESIVGKLYVYENNKFEFVLFDDQVVRLNVYSGTYWGYDDTTLSFQNENDLFSMFGIKPNTHLKKIEDTNYALRFSPVSDSVADFWVIDIQNGTFGEARITYNLNYY